MTRLFISYSRSNSVFAHRLAKSLDNIGVNAWIDVEEIAPGMKWSTTVQNALDSYDMMIVVISPDSMASKNVEDEWQYYMDEGKSIIPVLLLPAKIPFQLRRIQYIDFHEREYDAAFTDLLRILKHEEGNASPESTRAFEILQSKYRDWLLFNTRDGELLNDNTLNLVTEYLAMPEISMDLLEYLFISLAHRLHLKNFDLEKVSLWIAKLTPEATTDLFGRLLSHTLEKVRINVLRLVAALEITAAADLIITRLHIETEASMQRAALYTLYRLGTVLPETMGNTLLENSSDWIVQTYALQVGKKTTAALLVTDKTEFAEGFAEVLHKTNYVVVTLLPENMVALRWDLEAIDTKLLAIYDLIVLMRGEHYGDFGTETLYAALLTYVKNGGRILATSWVGWETKQNPIFAEMLPFEYISYHEDVPITCQPTNYELAQELFAPQISYVAALEKLTVKPNAVMLLSFQKNNSNFNNVPIFGYQSFGQGICYYLNTCQHSCTRPTVSPLKISSDLQESLERVFRWIGQY